MEKISVDKEKAAQTLSGPARVRLSDMALHAANKEVLGPRWPKDGVFTLTAKQKITLPPGSVVYVDRNVAEDPDTPVSEKSDKAKAKA